MVSYPQPYPIVTHQSPAHGAGGGPGSQSRDSIGMGHVTRQVKLISAAVTHSTSTDSLYITRLSDNLGPIRSGPDSRSRTVTRYCNKEKYSAHDFTTLLFPIKRIYILPSSPDDSSSTFASCSTRPLRLFVDSQIFQPLGALRSTRPSTHPWFLNYSLSRPACRLDRPGPDTTQAPQLTSGLGLLLHLRGATIQPRSAAHSSSFAAQAATPPDTAQGPPLGDPGLRSSPGQPTLASVRARID